jgi:hypothetical protein
MEMSLEDTAIRRMKIVLEQQLNAATLIFFVVVPFVCPPHQV